MIKLADYSTKPEDGAERKKLEKITKENIRLIGKKCKVMNIQGKHSLLVVFQGMDCSGKDGAVENVFGRCSPIGLKQYSFKKPTPEELAHDFLWRIHSKMPAKGEIVLFNRSHYEDILIQRVHHWIDEERVKLRMASINAFEELVEKDNQTTILKFYLHISYREQEQQLLQRVSEPEKRYKHNDADWTERQYWDDYSKAYEYIFNESRIPWHIVPVDERWYRDYVISTIVLRKLEELDIAYPELPKLENFNLY